MSNPKQLPPGRPPTIERRLDHGIRVVVVRDLAHLGWGMKVARKG
jgi:hypothetical protein